MARVAHAFRKGLEMTPHTPHATLKRYQIQTFSPRFGHCCILLSFWNPLQSGPSADLTNGGGIISRPERKIARKAARLRRLPCTAVMRGHSECDEIGQHSTSFLELRRRRCNSATWQCPRPPLPRHVRSKSLDDAKILHRRFSFPLRKRETNPCRRGVALMSSDIARPCAQRPSWRRARSPRFPSR